MFLFQAHTLSHSWTLRAARAFFILGNPSLVLKSPPGVPPSMLQPRQHHSRPTLSPGRIETNPRSSAWHASRLTIQPRPPRNYEASVIKTEITKARRQQISDWPASLASLHAWHISCCMSGLSTAMASPTVTKRSTAKLTACPTRNSALRVRSDRHGRSRWFTSVVIWNKRN